FMSKNLKDYIVDRYKDVKYDLFSAFIVRNNQFSKENGNLGFMTPYVWMFISSYENLRRYLIDNACITSLIQFEYSAFEEATVPICTFTLKKTDKLKKGIYFRLVDYKGGMKVQEKMFFEEKENQKYYIREVDEFNRVPGSPIVYWLSNNMFNAFRIGQPLYKMGDTRQGMATSDVNRFTRFWYEVNDSQIGFNYNSLDGTKNGVHKWFPYIKGGKFRKWSGNNGTLVNWQFDGKEVKDYAAKLYKSYTRTIKNIGYYLRECISWGMITSSDISVRYYDSGYIFDIAGCCLFAEHKNLIYLLAFLNTKIARELTKAINPTINMNVGDIANLPIIYEEKYNSQIEKIIEENISISKREWDSFETSWDFKKHPLINMGISLFDPETKQKEELLSNNFNYWNQICSDWFNKLKQNEEELNRIFIDIYGLQDELTAEIEDKDITIRKADRTREIKSLISYAVGCMFGRYSLDEDGLIYAGGEFDSSKYKTFNADTDNIIPITDEAYFNDDMVTRFKKFIEVVYGKETLYENLEYVAETLGKRGTETSEDTIRRYFVNDFYNDHVKTYKKRPIYWLFDSGKKNGFKCVIYMHRYSKDLVASIRTKYIPKVQTTYDKLLSDVEYKLSTDLSLTDKKEMEKKKIELNSKIQEVKEYYEKIAYVANKMIDIDLDDGVVVNYAKFTYLNPKTNKEEIILGNTK
ncbi:MAG: BREX-1 system adenine-specific DNA-methyltransferase PglX, partial [Bacilli bacterium]